MKYCPYCLKNLEDAQNICPKCNQPYADYSDASNYDFKSLENIWIQYAEAQREQSKHYSLKKYRLDSYKGKTSKISFRDMREDEKKSKLYYDISNQAGRMNKAWILTGLICILPIQIVSLFQCFLHYGEKNFDATLIATVIIFAITILIFALILFACINSKRRQRICDVTVIGKNEGYIFTGKKYINSYCIGFLVNYKGSTVVWLGEAMNPYEFKKAQVGQKGYFVKTGNGATFFKLKE